MDCMKFQAEPQKKEDEIQYGINVNQSKTTNHDAVKFQSASNV